MDRRDFLKNTGTIIAGAALAPRALSQSAPQSAASKIQGRLVLPMNRNWRFSRSGGQEVHTKAFDDSAFERVVIPHSNVPLPWHGFDEKSYEFVSSYRRRFKLPAEARGKRVFVDFEGVMTASTVWINGQRLGEYKGGYTPFSFDLTPHLDFDGENVLAIDVDSTERADIPPFGYEIDYLTFGGIYREVSLRVVPATFIENVFVRPKNALTATPGLEVDCFVQHLDSSHDPLTVEAELLDGERVVAKASQQAPSAGNATEPVTHTVSFPSLTGIKVWSMEERNLYSVRVRLKRGTQVVDEDSRRFGFREAQFTDHRFELNGKGIKLRGLDRHRPSPSWARRCPAGHSGAMP